jgi:hypothetical protein
MLELGLFVHFGQYSSSWIRMCIRIPDPDPDNTEFLYLLQSKAHLGRLDLLFKILILFS